MHLPYMVPNFLVKLLWIIIISSNSVDIAGGVGCVLRDKTIYVRNEGFRSLEKPKVVIYKVTLWDCAEWCTSKLQGVNCTSFEYDAMELICVLKENMESAILDTSNIVLLASSNNIALFQQLCIPEEHGCPSPYAFERLPGRVLIGIAREVFNVGTLEECLNLCLVAKKKLEIECKSVMYYYDAGECILNDEDRVTNEALISNDTFGMRVDYFENKCLDVNCPSDSTVHWIKIGRFTISDKHDVLVEQVTKEQCSSYCSDNKIHEQKFPCKSYAYSENLMACHLTSESGLAGLATSNLKISDTLETFEYYEKICLKGLKYNSPTRCQEKSFEHVPNHALMDFANKVVATSSMSSCLEICLRSGKQCSAAMFFQEKDECVLSEKTQYTNGNQFQYFPKSHYFDNVCDYVISTETSSASDSETQSLAHKQSDDTSLKMLQHIIDSDSTVVVEHDALFMDNLQEPVHEKVNTECGEDRISIAVHFMKPTTGAVFIKDHFDTCRFEFNKTMNATMEIASPALRQDNPSCPGYRISPSIWTFVVVVQKNELGVPALITDVDNVISIFCDYSNDDMKMLDKKGTILLPEALYRDRPNVSTSTDYVRLEVLRDGQPVSTAMMGEELEMRWTLAEDRMNNVGFYLNRCVAERLDGRGLQPPPITLIVNGCISSSVNRFLMQHPIVQFDNGFSTRFKVFRFDGSYRVKILCSLDICIKECLPANCDKDISDNMAYSDREKRQTLDYNSHQNSDDYVKRKLITGTFTIIEKREKMEVSENFSKINEQPNNQSMTHYHSTEDGYTFTHFLCFMLVVFVVLLSVVQTYMCHKYVQTTIRRSGSSDSEDSTGSPSVSRCGRINR